MHLNELDVRKPLVESISQRSEELRLWLEISVFQCTSWFNGPGFYFIIIIIFG
jgi:hypothetical protein